MNAEKTPARLEALAEAAAATAEAFLLRHYGQEGRRTATAVAKAIRTHELPPNEKTPAARETLADVAGHTLLARRGYRDLGTVTELGMAIRRITLED